MENIFPQKKKTHKLTQNIFNRALWNPPVVNHTIVLVVADDKLAGSTSKWNVVNVAYEQKCEIETRM